MPTPPIITLLTDFGLADHYVAAMKGVILGICPEARLIDITHEIKAFAIADAAFTLAQAWPCFPAGSVHAIVVDPGVGSSRRPLLLRANGHFFVAPDNGVLTMVYNAASEMLLYEIASPGFFRHPVSRTFHGRDIFAPVAAHLAGGAPPEEMGTIAEHPVRLSIGDPTPGEDGSWAGQILHVDRYGNLVTNFRATQRRFELLIGRHRIAQCLTNYAAGEPHQLFAIEGSSGLIEVSQNQGSASSFTGATTGDALALRYL